MNLLTRGSNLSNIPRSLPVLPTRVPGNYLMRKFVCLMLVAISCNAYGQEELRSVVDQPVSTGSEHINFLHQREWVRLSADGSIAGKLSVLSPSGETEGRIGAKVIVSRDGKAFTETSTDERGAFTLTGLKPGTYAIQCRGDYTFAAYALHVLPADAAHLTTDLEIYASVIPEARASELLAGDLVPADLQAESSAYYRNFDKDPIADERKFNNTHKVVLRNGTLVGRVSRPGWTFGEQDLTGTIAQIVQDGKVIGKTSVNKDGYYEIQNVEPGVYDLFVNGDDGFAVLSFEAVAGNEPVASKSGSIRMVSAQIGMASDCLCCEMIQAPELNACSTCAPIAPPPMPIVEEIVAIGEPCGLPVDSCGCGAAPVCGGGYAGGFGGGGGGGFGGGLGGIGGLLGVAGLAVGVAALADDNDDSGFNVNLATPLR